MRYAAADPVQLTLWLMVLPCTRAVQVPARCTLLACRLHLLSACASTCSPLQLQQARPGASAHVQDQVLLPRPLHRLFNSAAERVMNRLRCRTFRHIIGQEMGFFDRVRVGELVNRLSEVRFTARQSCE